MRASENPQKTSDARLAERLTEIAVAASAAILAVDFRNADMRRKADNSPVTMADEAAQAVILDGLARLMPGVPVVSEEAAGNRPGKSEFLLVDPLDGTVEFLAGRPEYTVNIALVRDGIPVLGLVAAPALGLIWRGATDHGAERLRVSPDGSEHDRATIRTRSWPAGAGVAAVSRSHYDPTSAAFLAHFTDIATLASGSAVKFCRIAEGAADIYPRLAPTSEWDVGAGHALVVAAGGVVMAPDGGPLLYGGGENFRVPGFIAWGDPAAARRLVR